MQLVTGPLELRIDPHAVRLPGDVWLDRNGNGRFEPDEQMTKADNPGVVLSDDQGREFSTAGPGTPAEIAVEQAGPLRACVRIAGWHQSTRGGCSATWPACTPSAASRLCGCFTRSSTTRRTA